MKIKELKPVKLNGAWEAEKGAIEAHLRELQAATIIDLGKIEDKIDCPTPSPEGAVGAVVATAGAFMLSPVLGIGLALMSYESILSAIGNHEECLKKSRVVRVARALVEAPKNGRAEEAGEVASLRTELAEMSRRMDLLIKATQKKVTAPA